MKITVGVQYGDPASDRIVHPIKKELTTHLERGMSRDYFRTILEIGIVLRVSGAIWKFEPAGASRLRHNKRSNIITADLVIPESEWRERSVAHIKKYLATITLDCFEAIEEKTKKSKELVYSEDFRADSTQVISDFLQ